MRLQLSCLLLLCSCASPPSSEIIDPNAALEPVSPREPVQFDSSRPMSFDRVVVLVVESRGLGEPETERELTRAVALAYADYLRATGMSRVRADAAWRLDSLHAMVRSSVAAGEAPVSDGERMELALNQARLAQAQAQDDLLVATGALATLLDQPYDATLPPPADEHMVTVEQALESLVDAGLRQRRDVPSAEVRDEVTRAHDRLDGLLNELQRLPATPVGTWDAAMARYQTGMASVDEVLSVHRALVEADGGVVELGARIAAAAAALEFAVGGRLTRLPLPAR